MFSSRTYLGAHWLRRHHWRLVLGSAVAVIVLGTLAHRLLIEPGAAHRARQTDRDRAWLHRR
jgi:hypothetical protein